MTEKARKYLSDILLAINLVEEFISDTKDFDEYTYDLKTQSAVERQLSIIGEAVNKFLIECPECNLKYSLEIVGFRNRLVHAYDKIDNSIVWTILRNYLMPLKEDIQKLQ